MGGGGSTAIKNSPPLTSDVGTGLSLTLPSPASVRSQSLRIISLLFSDFIVFIDLKEGPQRRRHFAAVLFSAVHQTILL